ncbi:FAD-dependent oxidoreductase [Spirosoma sordidisoli]|uniref:FAD-dependent oxidoreductase n=1 Tax=Spirosoma sordidisoli TaxID=2502893 RepID=A0A4Q2UIC8_9BACT|nr:FAD-dependent oxidoreductase [Spirosoma sordidisoli]RYC67110.1 FAD-dependent oxidoreductase [Spirosoma sordidisoli]
MPVLTTDILIVGGGVGGCACALAACEAGLTVILTEESDWIGGQFTTQATPPDEHGWIEQFGCTQTYRQFRENVRDYYRTHYPLTPEARLNPTLNPGNGWVSPLCAEPIVFLRVLQAMLQPYIDRQRLTILYEYEATEAVYEADTVQSVTLQHTQTSESVWVNARYFVDATELGDLLPLTGTDYVTGSESQAETGELSAAPVARPGNVQAFSVCFAMSYHEGEDWTIDKPARYDYWRTFVPPLLPAWSGPLLSLTGLSPRTLQPVQYNFQPNREPNRAFAGLWTYRRILDKNLFQEGAFESDITLVNYPQIDYLGGDLSEASPAERARYVQEAKEQSLSFLYYLQTELGFRGLKLRPDVVGTADGLAKRPYIRESRRIKAEFTIREQHVSAHLRPGSTLAEPFPDSVGLGFYRIDLHPSLGGDNYIDVESLPFQIPLGSLLPERVENLLPACKNIGTTHITNGCYRLHPIEWNIGESVGHLLAYCLEKGVSPRQVRNTPTLLIDFQAALTRRGIPIEWPDNLVLSEGDPHRHAL